VASFGCIYEEGNRIDEREGNSPTDGWINEEIR
jgi:hypothetical protein